MFFNYGFAPPEEALEMYYRDLERGRKLEEEAKLLKQGKDRSDSDDSVKDSKKDWSDVDVPF